MEPLHALSIPQVTDQAADESPVRRLAEYLYRYIFTMRRLVWLGTSLDDLRAMPASARVELGTDLRWVQQGADPRDWRPMPTVGAGVREIRVRTLQGAFRALYVVEGASELYVLHVFQKKTEQTATHDIRKGRARYKLVP